MFGFSWGEIGIIMAVALIAIGPKDLPVAIRTVTGLIKKARGMASEFQGHVDEMMREANIADVVDDVKKAASMTQGAMARSFVADGLLGKSRTEMDAMVEKTTSFGVPAEVEQEQVAAPRYIPPDAARKAPVPAFIPPGTKRWGF